MVQVTKISFLDYISSFSTGFPLPFLNSLLSLFSRLQPKDPFKYVRSCYSSAHFTLNKMQYSNMDCKALSDMASDLLWLISFLPHWSFWCSSNRPGKHSYFNFGTAVSSAKNAPTPEWLIPLSPSSLCSNVIILMKPTLTNLFKIATHNTSPHTSDALYPALFLF